MAVTSSSHNYNHTKLKAHSKYFCTSVHINISLQQLQRQIYHPWFNVSQLPRAYKFKNYIHHKDWHTPNFWEGLHTPCSWLERITRDTCICYTVLQEEIEARPETEVQWSNLCNFECEGPGWNVRAKGLSKEWRVSWAVAWWQWAVAVAHGRWHAHFPCPGIQVACHVCIATWSHTRLVDVSAERKAMKYGIRWLLRCINLMWSG